MNKLIYLAGPIDFVPRESALGWRKEAQWQLEYAGFASYNPASAFLAKKMPELAMAIDCVNREALRHCCALIAHIKQGEVAFGTIREIEYCTMSGKPVYLVAPHLAKSYCVYDLILCDSIRNAVDRLKTGFETRNRFLTQAVSANVAEPQPAGQPEH